MFQINIFIHFFYVQLIGCAYFTHRFGCQKCLVRGKKLRKRMSFPRTDAGPRTDDNFRNPNEKEKAEILHIKEYSILQELPIDMVKSFVVADPLHLLELGNMKKYEEFYCNGISCLLFSVL